MCYTGTINFRLYIGNGAWMLQRTPQEVAKLGDNGVAAIVYLPARDNRTHTGDDGEYALSLRRRQSCAWAVTCDDCNTLLLLDGVGLRRIGLYLCSISQLSRWVASLCFVSMVAELLSCCGFECVSGKLLLNRRTGCDVTTVFTVLGIIGRRWK